MRTLIYCMLFLGGILLLRIWLQEPAFEDQFWNQNKRELAVSTAAPAAKKSLGFTREEDFYRWQKATRAHYQGALAPPSEDQNNATIKVLHREQSSNSLTREFFEISTTDGVRIPGVLQFSETVDKSPAVIVVPGHTKPGDSGLSQVVREADSYQHAAATRLAEAGFVTAAIELRGFGLLGPADFPEHKIVAYNELLKGSSYKARVLSDLKALYEYLAGKPFVESGRIGVTGASLGGELAVALGASLPAIRAVAFSSYIEQGPFSGFKADRRKQPHYCHLIPGIAGVMNKEDVFKLLAPRPTLGVREVLKAGEFRRFSSSMRNLWSLLDHPENFEFVEIENGKHEFYLEPTVEFFKRHL